MPIRYGACCLSLLIDLVKRDDTPRKVAALPAEVGRAEKQKGERRNEKIIRDKNGYLVSACGLCK